MIEPMEKVPDPNCGVCLRDPSTDPADGGCICPECRICGVVGDPKCWTDHFPAAPKAEEGKAEPRPGGLRSIEQAAREYVAAVRAMIEARDPILQREMSEAELDNRDNAEDAAWTNLCVAVDGWTPDSQAPTAQSAPPPAGPSPEFSKPHRVIDPEHLEAALHEPDRPCTILPDGSIAPAPALEPPAPRLACCDHDYAPGFCDIVTCANYFGNRAQAGEAP